MNCPNCGALMMDGAKFCAKCGTRLADVPSQPQGYAPQPTGPQPGQQAYPPQQQVYPQQQPYGNQQQPYANQQPGYGQQQAYAQPNYAQPNYAQGGYNPQQQAIVPAQAAPQAGPLGPRHMDTNRSLLIVVLLTIVTCGIYYYYFIYKCAQDANEICQDGEKTGGVAAYILLSFVTLGIYSLYWEYKLANRLQANAPRYGQSFQESGTNVLLWRLLGALICGLGSFYGTYIWINNLNRLSAAYNAHYGV